MKRSILVSGPDWKLLQAAIPVFLLFVPDNWLPCSNLKSGISAFTSRLPGPFASFLQTTQTCKRISSTRQNLISAHSLIQNCRFWKAKEKLRMRETTFWQFRRCVLLKALLKLRFTDDKSVMKFWTLNEKYIYRKENKMLIICKGIVEVGKELFDQCRGHKREYIKVVSNIFQ